ncbi:MAG TPA: tetratricopeptide repeat protein [Thermoanaerobaculia bacterium]
MDRAPAARHGYSTRDVAALLGLSVAQVRSYVRAGLLTPVRGPGREQLFTFQDLILLRAAKGLIAARVPSRRIQKALAKLRQQLPDGRPLSGVRISARGQEVVVRDGGELWLPESGQALFDFAVAELAKEAATLPLLPVQESVPPPETAEGWYARGYELEEEQPAEAIAAYRHALEMEPAHADAHLNLGRLLHEGGRVLEAERHYRLACAARPDDATAAFDLGVALQDLGRVEEAIAAYEQALALDPRLADAHYNLTGLYELLGQSATAFGHLRTYFKLTQAL